MHAAPLLVVELLVELLVEIVELRVVFAELWDDLVELRIAFVESMASGGAIIASIISCEGCLPLERTLEHRGGLNFLLTGNPEALIVGRTVY